MAESFWHKIDYLSVRGRITVVLSRHHFIRLLDAVLGSLGSASPIIIGYFCGCLVVALSITVYSRRQSRSVTDGSGPTHIIQGPRRMTLHQLVPINAMMDTMV